MTEQGTFAELEHTAKRKTRREVLERMDGLISSQSRTRLRAKA